MNDAVGISEEINLPSGVLTTDTTEEEPIEVGDWWAVEYSCVHRLATYELKIA